MKKKFASFTRASASRNVEDLIGVQLTHNVNQLEEQELTFGDYLADKIASFAGGWTFIIIFLLLLGGWIAVNTLALIIKPFDPFPYILLNLVLGCVSSLQAPFIMMSQNRQQEKDRLRSEHDYEITLKSEILIEEIVQRLFQVEEITQHLVRIEESVEQIKFLQKGNV
ncbi:MAG TPA: DUF1003 domain-containing protein [Clostridiaceae bacterium]